MKQYEYYKKVYSGLKTTNTHKIESSIIDCNSTFQENWICTHQIPSDKNEIKLSTDEYVIFYADKNPRLEYWYENGVCMQYIFFKQRGGICITMKEQYRQYIKEMEKDGTCLGY